MTYRAGEAASSHTLFKQPSGAYKGITPPRYAKGKWVAVVSFKNKQLYHVGTFDDQEEAARAHLRAWNLIKAGKVEGAELPSRTRAGRQRHYL